MPHQAAWSHRDRGVHLRGTRRVRVGRDAAVSAALCRAAWVLAWLLVLTGGTPEASARQAGQEPIVYTIRFPDPETHIADVVAVVPTSGASSVDLMLPVWSPGFYGLGDYAANVQEFAVRTASGDPLTFEKPKPNHWMVPTGGATHIIVSYGLLCQSRFVTGNWVGSDHAVINGPPTYITPSDETIRRPREVHLELPEAWPSSITSLEAAPDGLPHHYRAPDYDVFIDSPIVAGTISTHAFEVAGVPHVLADFGDLGAWDGRAAAAMLKPIVEEHAKLFRGVPYERYVFLNAFRRGGGGLEHLNSTLLTSGANPTEPLPSLRWLKFVSHEHCHAFNVKRLRPIELGPFDYEQLPRTPSLWISEGLTTYYGDLAVVRSGIGSPEDFLLGLSGHIRAVQTAPGRLVQTLEQASLTAGRSSSSGIGGDRDTTVSYYSKGAVVGFLLDARIRRLTDGARSLDDVMRPAYERYSGERGFRPEEFQAIASEVAGADLSAFFRTMLTTTEELDYTESLDWFGLQFVDPGSTEPAQAWRLEMRTDATPAQKANWALLLNPIP